MSTEAEFGALNRALAWPGFRPPAPRKEDPAGIHHEVRAIRTRLLLGQDDGAWLSPSILRKVLFDDSESDDGEDEEASDTETERWMDPEDASYWKYLKKLDPSNWKDQDHYRVLGLRRLRFAATPDQIRTAFRGKVRHHHPDKRRQRGEAVPDGDEDYFTCITRAHETLSVGHRRRAYDSIDKHFNDSTPTLEEARKDKANFFGLFRAAFETNARWSTVKPVPKLGDAKTERQVVEDFYSFWFEFTSWREFSYLDEEDAEKGENREERRWLERQNKSERDRRRKEEAKRIRTLVETAYATDPRIAAFRDGDKRRKEEEKEKRKEAQRQRKEDEKKAREEAEATERDAAVALAAAEKAKREEDRKEKQLSKKERTKQRKLLEAFLKEADYFEPGQEAKMGVMEEMTKLSAFCGIPELCALNAKLRSPNGHSAREAFAAAVEALESRLASESALSSARLLDARRADEEEKASAVAAWATDELQLLVKAASTLYPVGSRARYEQIAAFVNEHRKLGPGEAAKKEKTAKDVIAKAKEMGNVEASEAKETVKAATTVIGSKKAAAVEAQGGVTEVTEGEKSVQWSKEEQKMLENALRTVGASPQRWEVIASQIPGKSKADCIRRYKELAELVKAKRSAQQAAAITKLAQ